jgi:ArsR family transcriptional regulator
MEKQLQSAERLFQALGDATRLRILGLLLAGEVCVCDIHESLRIPQPKASRHLAYLRRAGLVETRRQGLWVYYRLAEASDPVLSTLRAVVRHALGHVDEVRRDARRLERKTGCCVPESAATPGFACCASSPGTGGRGAGAGDRGRRAGDPSETD